MSERRSGRERRTMSADAALRTGMVQATAEGWVRTDGTLGGTRRGSDRRSGAATSEVAEREVEWMRGDDNGFVRAEGAEAVVGDVRASEGSRAPFALPVRVEVDPESFNVVDARGLGVCEVHTFDRARADFIADAINRAPPVPSPGDARAFDRHTPIDAGARLAEMERDASMRTSAEAAERLAKAVTPTPANEASRGEEEARPLGRDWSTVRKDMADDWAKAEERGYEGKHWFLDTWASYVAQLESDRARLRARSEPEPGEPAHRFVQDGDRIALEDRSEFARDGWVCVERYDTIEEAEEAVRESEELARSERRALETFRAAPAPGGESERERYYMSAGGTFERRLPGNRRVSDLGRAARSPAPEEGP